MSFWSKPPLLNDVVLKDGTSLRPDPNQPKHFQKPNRTSIPVRFMAQFGSFTALATYVYTVRNTIICTIYMCLDPY